MADIIKITFRSRSGIEPKDKVFRDQLLIDHISIRCEYKPAVVNERNKPQKWVYKKTGNDFRSSFWKWRNRSKPSWTGNLLHLAAKKVKGYCLYICCSDCGCWWYYSRRGYKYNSSVWCHTARLFSILVDIRNTASGNGQKGTRIIYCTFT